MAMQTTTNRQETATLIASDKVEGTPVYRSNGDQVGTIEHVMIEKIGGKVAYAVMSFGGFLGTYNERLGGYEVNLTEQQLKGAPHYGQHENWNWEDQARTEKLNTYYGTTLVG
jgi:sporulation protein YlmC with PRC-barrel domain